MSAETNFAPLFMVDGISSFSEISVKIFFLATFAFGESLFGFAY